jgi:raffinose/stachyose/melibiose transport system substrate-binding protein
MLQAGVDGDFTGECFVKAGQDIADLVALDPFQPDFLAAPYGEPTGQAAWVANGQAAMELMGHWAPFTQVGFAANGEGLGDTLGFAGFPLVEGGAGVATDLFGGGNGYAVGANASPEAIDFLAYLSTPEVATRIGEAGKYLPVVAGAEGSVADPNMQAIVGHLGGSTYVQLYLDQAYAPAVGEAVNDNVQFLLAGQYSPEEVAANLTAAAQAE